PLAPDPELAGRPAAPRRDTPAPETPRPEAPRPEAPRAARSSETPDAAPHVDAEPAAGSLTVASEPWAAVRIDGRAAGTTPVGPLALAPGRHTVTLENPGFPPYETALRIAPGEAARVAVSLWQTVARVTLDVAPWAVVWVDGQRWETVPPQPRPLALAPGTHALRFEHPTLGTRETTLRVAAGEQRTVQIRMDRPAP
ncbi:MAG TPA: PEGA domain-containing protein, partial [Rubricoccaceae bacterium]